MAGAGGKAGYPTGTGKGVKKDLTCLQPKEHQCLPQAPGTIPNTSLPILHEDLGPSGDANLGRGSSLAFTSYEVPSYIWVSVGLGAWDSGDT